MYIVHIIYTHIFYTYIIYIIYIGGMAITHGFLVCAVADERATRALDEEMKKRRETLLGDVTCVGRRSRNWIVT